MQFLGFLAHVDDVVLAKHLWGVGLVPTRSAQRLAWNIQPLDAAGAFRKDSANTSEEDWQKGKWLKVSDVVHSISLPRLVAKLMPFFKLPASDGNCFFLRFWPAVAWGMKMQNILNFCRRITKKQSKFEGVVVPRKTVLSIHFSNLFPQMTLNKWKENRNVLTPRKSDNLLQQEYYIFRSKNHPCETFVNFMHACVGKSPKIEAKEGVWWRAVAACKQMDEQMSRRRNELEAEFTRGLNQNGKLVPFRKQGISRTL